MSGVTDHQVKCWNPECNAIFDSVQEMFAVQGRGERSPRHFCESCFEEIRSDNDRCVEPDTDHPEGEP